MMTARWENIGGILKMGRKNHCDNIYSYRMFLLKSELSIMVHYGIRAQGEKRCLKNQ